jgi:hypothetical protein
MKIINHSANGLQIGQRRNDGYVNLTQMAKASGKKLNDYLRLDTTKAFFNELSTVTGIPVTGKNGLIEIRQGGNDKTAQGTWGHPQIAIHCGQWCSAEFAVLVSKWVVQWMTTGINLVQAAPAQISDDLLSTLDRLEQLLVSIRSQARTLHTGTHQPVDETLLKSLHSLTHNQLAIIAEAIGLLQMLRQVASIAHTVEETIVDLPSSESDVKTNFITSFSVPNTEATTRFTVDLPLSMHRKLSILAARTGRKKAEIVRMLLDEALSDVED